MRSSVTIAERLQASTIHGRARVRQYDWERLRDRSICLRDIRNFSADATRKRLHMLRRDLIWIDKILAFGTSSPSVLCE